jgi:hypothetical protein
MEWYSFYILGIWGFILSFFYRLISISYWEYAGREDFAGFLGDFGGNNVCGERRVYLV